MTEPDASNLREVAQEIYNAPESEPKAYINLYRVMDVLLKPGASDLHDAAREVYEAGRSSAYAYLPKSLIERFEELAQGWEIDQLAARISQAIVQYPDGPTNLEELGRDLDTLRQLCNYESSRVVQALMEAS